MTDAEWVVFLEQCALITEGRVWEAEASINNARCESIMDDLWLKEDPARHERYFGSDRREFLDGITNDYRRGCAVERAAYDWRRDHGEWPATADLTERLMAQTGISRRAAKIRIDRAVNDSDPDRHLYIIPAAELAAVLAEGPHGSLWNGPTDVRFYVAAPGHARCAALYGMLRMAAA